MSINNRTIKNNMERTKKGYLELILGPMYSGKTSTLLNIYRQCTFCNSNVVVINYEGDKRYSDTMMSTHDKIMIPCILGTTISNIIKNNKSVIDDCDVILINEGQFFSDIVETVLELVEKQNKRVYICGLDGDFKRERIGNLLNLIPHCDEIYKLKSLCSECKDGTHGIFSFRTTDEKDQVVIGSDIYKPLCRSCYNTLSLNKYM
jgi:thymidine kinase